MVETNQGELMTLRKKTLLITAVTIACLMVGLYFLSSAILLQGFSDVEDESVRESIGRVEHTLQNEITTLGNITRDWASWDDTYAFIEDHNDEYIESNLMLDTSYVNNRLNLMVYVNSAGETVYSKGFDLSDEKTAPVPEGMNQFLAPGGLLLQKPDATEGISGIIILPEGPMLVASEPILTSERETPARGSLIWGRFLNDAEVEHLSRLTGLNLAIYRLDNPGLPADVEDARAVLTGGAAYIKPFSNDMIAGYKELNDITGKPALILRTEQLRPVYAQGQATIRYLLIAIFGVGLVLGTVTLLLLERLVLSRIAHLRREVSSIGTSVNHAGRVHMTGKDELADFARVINAALDALEKSRERLREAHDELEERVSERTSELSSLYNLSRSLVGASLNFSTILNLVTRHAVDTIHITYAQVAMLEGDELVIRGAYPVRPLGHDLNIGQRLPLAEMKFCRELTENDGPVILRSDTDKLGDAEQKALFLGFTHTLCLIPMHLGERATGILMLGEARNEKREPFTPEKVGLARGIADQAASALRGAELFIELEGAYLETVIALAKTVDAKDSYTGDHGQRLAEMAMAISREIGVEGEELQDLHYGAILHDIGKIGVPDAVLQKPGRLTSREWIEMRKHPFIGSQILSAVSYLGGAARIVHHHHERFDGTGYPDGLASEEIPLGARVLAVVDAYSAIVDKRVYKEARTHEEAVAELVRCSGTQFDPEIVKVFLKLYRHAKVA